MSKALLGYLVVMAVALAAVAVVMHKPSASAGGAKNSLQQALEQQKKVLDEI